MSDILAEALNGVKTVAIGGHVRPDGDCVGACSGLYHYLTENYPELCVTVYSETIPECYRAVAGSVNYYFCADEDHVYDLFIALDCGDRERLGGFAKYFDSAKKTLCVDHHISNQAFAMLN